MAKKQQAMQDIVNIGRNPVVCGIEDLIDKSESPSNFTIGIANDGETIEFATFNADCDFKMKFGKTMHEYAYDVVKSVIKAMDKAERDSLK